MDAHHFVFEQKEGSFIINLMQFQILRGGGIALLDQILIQMEI